MERIIIDTDPGIDDAFALLLALKSDELIIEGITTVEGNGSIDMVTKNALKIVSLADRKDVRVYKGCRNPKEGDLDIVKEIHGYDALGDVISGDDLDIECEKEHAVDFILRTVREKPGEITLIALGPLHNIGEAIKREPNTMNQVKKIVMMGGAIHGGNVSPVAEANFYNAPEAAKLVFQTEIKDKVMIGLDGTYNMFISSNVREIMKQINSKAANLLYRITEVYVKFYWNKIGKTGFVPHDVLVMIYLLKPSIVEVRDCNIQIVTEGLAQGQSIVDFDSETINAKACTGADANKAVCYLLNGLFPEHKDEIERVLINLKAL